MSEYKLTNFAFYRKLKIVEDLHRNMKKGGKRPFYLTLPLSAPVSHPPSGSR
jgi:hypothetical protein